MEQNKDQSGAAVRGEAVAELSYKGVDGKYLDAQGWNVEHDDISSTVMVPIHRKGEVIALVVAECTDDFRDVIAENCRILCDSARAADALSEPSDDEIVAIARQAIRDGSAMWDHFTKDDAGKFTVPVLDPKDFMLVRAVLAAVKSRAADALDSQPTAMRPTDDELWDATLRDRDAYHEWADKLADAIALHCGVDIGEHSNQNLPWAEALEAIENADCIEDRSQPTDGGVRNDHDLKAVHAFLMGESALEGVQFGDKHPTKAGAYWWRLNLRAALAKG